MHLLKWTFLDGPGGKIEIELEQNSQDSKYAILSHRWGETKDEVSFQDMLSGSDLVKTKPGYAKLESCCRQAHQDGYKRVWSDTCCIDKFNSAELSEAITSMYSYYENSQVCYAFLNDIEKRTEPPAEGDTSSNSSPLISKSAWFERGWTLQELIAPETVKFFDLSWRFIGEKKQLDIRNDIEKHSGIHSSILMHPKIMRAVSVSSRMSWAAQRKTTRIEDRAYSLMGIFGVFMPPMYGEGHNAFVRLQEEIMRTSNDHTLFAWTLPPPKDITQRHTFERVSTMLALSPDQFKESSEFMHRPYNSAFNSPDAKIARLAYSTTNAGLSINLPIVRVDKKQELYAAILACTEGESIVSSAILLHTTADTPLGYFWRANTNAGPIERSGKLWFQAEGRNTLKLITVYILPKLTSVSRDNIEPAWGSLNFSKRENMASVRFVGYDHGYTPIPSPTFKTVRTLVQAQDPFYKELQDLSQARHIIYGQAAHLYEEQLKRRRLFLGDFPWQSSGRFFGRLSELRSIREFFEVPRGREQPNVVVISGIGKIGKTELARESVYSCRDTDLFTSIIWIDASTSETIHGGFRQVAQDLNFKHGQGELSKSEEVAKILNWLGGLGSQSDTSRGILVRQWLLILDNAQNFEDLREVWKLIAGTGKVRVLVTSRNSTFGSELSPGTIILGPLDDSEANHMLQSLTLTTEDLIGVVACWDGTPLTLAQVSRLVPANQELGSFEAHTASTLKHRRNGLALSESLNSQISELRQSTFALLAVISFLSAGSIDSSILIRSTASPLRHYPLNNHNVRKNLKKLMESSLVTPSMRGNSIEMLQLVQNEVQNRLKPVSYNKALATAVSLIHNVWEHRVSLYKGRQWISDNLLGHLLRLETLAEKLSDSKDDLSTRKNLAWLVRSREKL